MVLGERAEDWNEWRRRVGSECGWDEHEQPLKRGGSSPAQDGRDSQLEVLKGGVPRSQGITH